MFSRDPMMNMMMGMQRSFFNDPFFNDPFFSDPFGTRAHRQDPRSQMLAPFGGDIFADMHQRMMQMQEQMMSGFSNVPQPGSNQSAFIQQSSFSMSNMNGTPQVYQETSTTRNVNGVAETQRSILDSKTNKEEVVIERRIGDRARSITRTRVNGEESKVDNLQNIDFDHADEFDREWQEEARRNRFRTPSSNLSFNSLAYDSNPHVQRLTGQPSSGGSRTRHASQPRIELVNDDEPGAQPVQPAQQTSHYRSHERHPPFHRSRSTGPIITELEDEDADPRHSRHHSANSRTRPPYS